MPLVIDERIETLRWCHEIQSLV